MNKNKLDELFKLKLANFRKEPEPGTWLNIRDQLNDTSHKKSNFYLKIAAGFLLISLIGGTLWYFGYQAGINNTQKVVTEQDIDNNKSQNETPLLTDNEKLKENDLVPEEVINEEDKVNTITQSKSQNLIVSKKEDNPVLIKKIENFPEKLNPLQPGGEFITQNKPDVKDYQDKKNLISNTGLTGIKELPPVTITYKAGDENLTLNDESKISTFKKVIDFALDLKNGEEQLPSIKEIKNDLFVLNKKNKRSNTQNKDN